MTAPETPDYDTHPEHQWVWVDGMKIDAVVIHREWAAYQRAYMTRREAEEVAAAAARNGADETPDELRARLTNEERAEGRRDLTFPWNGPWRSWLLKHGEALLDAADDVTRLEAERDALLARLTAAEAENERHRLRERLTSESGTTST
jgi:hypothetical protein